MSAYFWYEMNHAAMAPWRAAAGMTKLLYDTPLNPLSETPLGRNVAAGAELFERMTRRYGKPAFGIAATEVNGRAVAIEERVVLKRPFCRLLHFRKSGGAGEDQPKLLLVAPLSGHYATLLRGTVEALLPDNDVFITDWIDARQVPLSEGTFGFDDYVDDVRAALGVLREAGRGRRAHAVAVCQPSVPVLVAAAVMAEDGDPDRPASMTLMGGPIDTRINPTAVNALAAQHDIGWFRRNVVMPVPFPHPGAMRPVYPGFLQLTGFMSMNLDRHVDAHRDLFRHLVEGDGDGAEKHREFYDEYLAVMDLDARFYLETVERVFIDHDLPEGKMRYRDRPVRPEAITDIALLTVEGERDDISGVGQTEAAHTLTPNLSGSMKAHHLQEHVGHYGVFNGSRFRVDIAPRISGFIAQHDDGASEPAAA